jgi:hypothetical protein
VLSRKALVICLATQKDRWPRRPVLRLTCPLLICLRFEELHSCAAVHQRCLGVPKAPVAAQNAIAQGWQQVTQLSWSLRKKDR